MNEKKELHEFAMGFIQNIVGIADSEGELIENTFFEEFCEHLMAAGELDSAGRAYHESDPTLGIRIDGYGGDPLESSGVLCLIVVDCDTSGDISALNRSEMERILNRPVRFLEKSLEATWRESLEESSPGYGLASLIANRWEDIKSIRVILITNRELKLRVDGMEAREMQGRQVAFNVWDISRIWKFVKSGEVREDMMVHLKTDFGGSVPIILAGDEATKQESYLGVLQGNTLAKIYDKWGARLLEQNVRVFLQARGKVNKGIRGTLVDNPEMFFAYNNGITCTAEGIVVENKNGRLMLSEITNFQIVNGGQTTASIHAAYLDGVDISDVHVQMKLSVVHAEEAEDIVPKISEYANTQNRVQAADFFSNHPFHVRIEEFSRKVYAPSSEGTFKQSKWFYERARGQYADARSHLTKAERRRFDQENPRSQLLSKTDLAKYLEVWGEKPEHVHLGAQKNFAYFASEIGKRWESNDSNFNEGYFREAVVKAIIFKSTEKMVSAQTWYEGGYRANIVAYSISKLANMVEVRNRAVDFSLIWRRQVVGSGISKILEIIAREVLDVLLDTPPTIKNVTEWAKSQACWEEVRKLKINWIPELDDETIPLEDQKSRRAGDRREQKVAEGIDAQAKVVKAGQGFWEQLLKWAQKESSLSEKELGIFQVAVQMDTTGKPPSEKQARALLELYERMREKGYNIELE